MNGLKGVRPIVTTDPAKLEAQAKGHVPDDAFGYVAGNAGNGDTAAANRRAFQQWSVGASS